MSKTSQLLCLVVLVTCGALPACRKNRGGLSKSEARWVRSRSTSQPSAAERKRLQRLSFKALRGGELQPDILVHLRRALERKPLSLEDEYVIALLAGRQCGRPLAEGWQQAADRNEFTWTYCGPEDFGVVRAAERQRWRGLSAMVGLLYGLLRDNRVSSQLARVLSRAWLVPHPKLVTARLTVQALPRGSTGQTLGKEPLLSLVGGVVRLDGQVLGKLSGAAGEADYARVDHALRLARTKQSPAGTQGALAIGVPSRTPYGTLRRIISSAKRAQWSTVHLVLRGREDEPVVLEVHTGRQHLTSTDPCRVGNSYSRILRDELRAQPTQDASPTKPGPLRPTLTIHPDGLRITTKHGAECATPAGPCLRNCAPTLGGQVQAAARWLTHQLWYLFAEKYRDPSNYIHPNHQHTLHVTAADTMPYHVVVRYLLAARTRPNTPGSPRLRYPIPREGCRKYIQPHSGKWTYGSSGGICLRELACMYDQLVLQ